MWLYLYIESFNPWFILLFAFFYVASLVSITGGYHRLFSHKAYEAHWSLRLFYALFGAAAFQQSILKWAGDHRVHHRFVDTDQDPYNINRGFWYAHMLWMFLDDGRRDEPSYQRYTMDLKRDKIVMWQDKYYVPLAIFMGFGLPTLIGMAMGSALGGLLFGGFLRLVIGHHVTFFINSLCHMWGKQTYTDTNTAKDSFVLALFTFGEGYHNFHHFFHNDYRNGVKWYSWDPTKWAINGAKWLGLADKLQRVSKVEIEKARMAMVEQRLLQNATGRMDSFYNHLQTLRHKWEVCGARWETAKSEYLELRRERAVKRCEVRNERLKTLKKELRQTRREMRKALGQWKAYSLQLRRVYN
jgi:stearoyl-CoA desaturase (Delta-9 desaturase)